MSSLTREGKEEERASGLTPPALSQARDEEAERKERAREGMEPTLRPPLALMCVSTTMRRTRAEGMTESG